MLYQETVSEVAVTEEKLLPDPNSADWKQLSISKEFAANEKHGESSSHGRQSFSQNLPPLEVGQRARSSAESSLFTSEGSKKFTKGAPRSLSLRSEKIVADRIGELSQLDSPQLRELARRLGELYRVETPGNQEPANQSFNREHPFANLHLGDRWEEIQGSNRWAGLLDPIDPVLRAEIVRYGEFAQATYDAFDEDSDSKYCGSSKYSKKSLLEEVGLENRGYEITDFLYATADLNLPSFFSRSEAEDTWSKDSNWIGFVAVCTSPKEIARLGRRDIVVAWRGTITKFEWVSDLKDYLSPAGFDPRQGSQDVMVENGFLSVYKSKNPRSRYNKTSAREQVLGAIKALVEKYKNEGKLSITVTGHSLGSALATLCAYDIAASEMNRLSHSPHVPNEWTSVRPDSNVGTPNEFGNLDALGGSKFQIVENYDDDEYEVNLEGQKRNRFQSDRVPITVYSFAGPRVGNRAFRDKTEELGVSVLRVVNAHDIVPKVPGVIFSNPLGKLLGFLTSLPSYKHVGVKLLVDHSASPFLRETRDPRNSHNMEAYLHLVDGYHGPGRPFQPTLRDFSLVNKRCDFLKREYFIPPCWWQEQNKGIVKDESGHWVLPLRDKELFPETPESPAEEEENAQYRVFLPSAFIARESGGAEATATRSRSDKEYRQELSARDAEIFLEASKPPLDEEDGYAQFWRSVSLAAQRSTEAQFVTET